MPNLVATSGSATANSFVTVAEADAYMDARLNASEWETDGGATDDSLRALIEATREINLLYFVGDRVTATQSLSWPRKYAIDPDYPRLAGVDYTDIGATYFGETVIPQRIKDATCELALEFIKAGTTDVAARDPNAEVASKTTDVLTTDFIDPAFRAAGLARYPRIVALLMPLLNTAGYGGLQVVRT